MDELKDGYVWVLMKEMGNHEEVPIGVYSTSRGVEKRLQSIEKANPQYELVETSKHSWRIGPEEDEGFFGHKQVSLRVQQVRLDR